MLSLPRAYGGREECKQVRWIDGMSAARQTGGFWAVLEMEMDEQVTQATQGT